MFAFRRCSGYSSIEIQLSTEERHLKNESFLPMMSVFIFIEVTDFMILIPYILFYP